MATITFDGDDAFCEIEDVVSVVQRGTPDTTSRPTLAETLNFMGLRAQEVQAVMWLKGYEKTTVNGTAAIDESDDTGKAVSRLARLANMMLAAGDYIAALDVREELDAPPAAIKLWENGANALDMLKEFLAGVATDEGRARSHTETGGVGKETFNESPQNTERKRSEVFHLDTRW